MLLHGQQFWTVVIGVFAPLVAYVVNHHGPQRTERIKAFVHVVIAAAAGAIYQGIQIGHVGFNGTTAQSVITAVVAALAAHNWFWRPSDIGTLFGAGTNAQDVGPAIPGPAE